MKWTKDLDDILKKLNNDGKTHKEISLIINKTKKSIACRLHRLKLKSTILHHITITCKFCGNEIFKTLSDEKIFCNHSCSARYNNKDKKHTEKTKEKIREKLLIYNKKTKEKIKKIKLCKICNKEIVDEKYKRICNKCRIQYYKFYRPLCEFDFNIYDYKNEFELSLIKKYGRYSPTNKKNNLSGISKDHIYSVKDGFINKINPIIIKHPANCRLMIHNENNKKNTKSLITIDELLLKIKNWNDKYKE